MMLVLLEENRNVASIMVAWWAGQNQEPGQGGMHTEPSLSPRVLRETFKILLRFGLHLSVLPCKSRDRSKVVLILILSSTPEN
jgi:hypothetical protein